MTTLRQKQTKACGNTLTGKYKLWYTLPMIDTLIELGITFQVIANIMTFRPQWVQKAIAQELKRRAR